MSRDGKEADSEGDGNCPAALCSLTGREWIQSATAACKRRNCTGAVATAGMQSLCCEDARRGDSEVLPQFLSSMSRVLPALSARQVSSLQASLRRGRPQASLLAVT